jgi:hypothetical protein
VPLYRAGDGHIQEFDDATLLSDGNIIYSCMSGAGEVSPDKKLIWHYDAPPGTEIHSCQCIAKNTVLIMRNGNPAQAMIFNTKKNKLEKVIPIPTLAWDNNTHGQFRHIRMTPQHTLLIPYLSEGKVVEYDLNGKQLWSVDCKSPWHAVRLKNGNTLIAGDYSRYVREVNPKGETVWELTKDDVPFELANTQTASRLANGDTLICAWIGAYSHDRFPGSVQVFEVNPDKKLVWVLSSWKDPDLGTATSIQLLDEPGKPEDLDQAR